jgi:hypothetical protein
MIDIYRHFSIVCGKKIAVEGNFGKPDIKTAWKKQKLVLGIGRCKVHLQNTKGVKIFGKLLPWLPLCGHDDAVVRIECWMDDGCDERDGIVANSG